MANNTFVPYTHIRKIYYSYDGEELGRNTVRFDINEVGDHPESADSAIKLLDSMERSFCPPEANPAATHTLFIVLH